MATNSSAEVFEEVGYGMHIFYGNDNIVTVDTHATQERNDVTSLGEPVSLLFLYSEEDDRQKDHRLERETKSRTHRRELGQGYNSMSRNRSPFRATREYSPLAKRVPLKELTDELKRHPIRSLTQIECGKGPISGSLLSKNLVRALAIRTDKPRNITVLSMTGYRLKQSLLYILYSGRLDGNNPWCLLRLRYGDNLRGHLCIGF
jgi:hypothetical protein